MIRSISPKPSNLPMLQLTHSPNLMMDLTDFGQQERRDGSRSRTRRLHSNILII